MRSSLLASVVGIAACSVFSSAMAQGAGPQEQADAEDRTVADSGLTEITVTARRREESLQETPVAVTALDGQRLEALGVQDVQEIARFAPNVVMDNFGGFTNSAVVFIRGVGGGAQNPADVQGGVGIYMDGVYMPRAAGGFLSTIDVERVEVLRGPQGTLFGKNTTGGAVNYISKKPGPQNESTWTLRAGNYDRIDVRGTINTPLIEDKLFARFTGLYEYRDGFMRELNTGDGYGNRNRISARAAFRYLPTDQLTLDFAGTLSDQDERPQGAVCIWNAPSTVQTRAEQATGLSFRDLCLGDRKGRTFTSDLQGEFPIRVSDLNAQATWESPGPVMGLDSLQLKLLTAWRQQTLGQLEDFDYSAVPIFQVARLGRSKQEQRTVELQINATALNERLSAVTGLYWADDDSEPGQNHCRDELATINLEAGESVDCISPGGFGVLLVPPNPLPATLGQGFARIETYSVYANATYDFNDYVSLTLGGRQTWEERSFSNLSFAVTYAGSGVPVAHLNSSTITNMNGGRKSWNEFTPAANLSFRLPSAGILDSGRLYLSYAKGFQSGGFNVDFRESDLGEAFYYEPETVDSYEIGLKTTLFGGRATANLAVFMSDFKDRQVRTIVENTGQFGNISDVNLTLVTNAATMSSDGVELEIAAAPVDGMLVNFTLGYIDARYDRFITFDPNLGQEVDASDMRVANMTPEWSITASAEYEFALPNGSTLTPRVIGYYRSGYEWLPNARFSDPKSPIYQPAYDKWDARLTWRSASGKVEVSAFGQNLFNKDTLRSGTAISARGWTALYLDAPRVYGVELQLATH